MLEIIQYATSSFSVFCGCAVLLAIASNGAYAIVRILVHR